MYVCVCVCVSLSLSLNINLCQNKFMQKRNDWQNKSLRRDESSLTHRDESAKKCGNI